MADAKSRWSVRDSSPNSSLNFLIAAVWLLAISASSLSIMLLIRAMQSCATRLVSYQTQDGCSATDLGRIFLDRIIPLGVSHDNVNGRRRCYTPVENVTILLDGKGRLRARKTTPIKNPGCAGCC